MEDHVRPVYLGSIVVDTMIGVIRHITMTVVTPVDIRVKHVQDIRSVMNVLKVYMEINVIPNVLVGVKVVHAFKRMVHVHVSMEVMEQNVMAIVKVTVYRVQGLITVLHVLKVFMELTVIPNALVAVKVVHALKRMVHVHVSMDVMGHDVINIVVKGVKMVVVIK